MGDRTNPANEAHVGIRKTIQRARERFSSGDEGKAGRHLTLSPEAIAAIRKHLEEKDQDRLVFRVATVPNEIGFSVKVGFDLSACEEIPRPEYPEVPVMIGDDDWAKLAEFTIDVRDGRFVTQAGITVHVADTPNPDARKFSVNRPVMESGSATFNRSAGEQAPPLARLLFRLEGVEAVFCIQSFITVTKAPSASWDELTSQVGKSIQAYFAHGGSPLAPSQGDGADRSEVEAKIVQILEDFIRPQVQRDGGDIVFAGFEDGTVSLYMQGSCVGCPSSTATLKMGIENLLKDAVPEVNEVVAIS